MTAGLPHELPINGRVRLVEAKRVRPGSPQSGRNDIEDSYLPLNSCRLATTEQAMVSIADRLEGFMARIFGILTLSALSCFLLAGRAQAQIAWSTQNPSGCSDQYGSYDAFIPGMRGPAACTRGGFVPGTNVIVVTNRNSSGSGSFEAAMSAACPKVVLMGVSGTIHALGTVPTNQCENWSLVGASAPGNIALVAGTNNPLFAAKGGNWTVDHMTFANGDSTMDVAGSGSGNRDAVSYNVGAGPRSNGIFLNSAILWGPDEGNQCYPSESDVFTNLLWWQTIIGPGGHDPNGSNHNLVHIIQDTCRSAATIRSFYIHNNGRMPLVRADGYFHANNVTANPGIQSVLIQPCGGAYAQLANVRMNIVNNFMVRGPDSSNHDYTQMQSSSCLSGSLTVHEAGNVVMSANHTMENCSNHGCASGGVFQNSAVSTVYPRGYIPETIPSTPQGALDFSNHVLAFVGPRPMDRLSYFRTKIDQAINMIDGNGAVGTGGLDVAPSTECGGRFDCLGDSAPSSYDPRNGANNSCGENMPTGAAADAIQSSGLTRLHEWVIGCFYDHVMPGGYREDKLQNYPAPTGMGSFPITQGASPSPPLGLQII